jgi:hypothetical protein
MFVALAFSINGQKMGSLFIEHVPPTCATCADGSLRIDQVVDCGVPGFNLKSEGMGMSVGDRLENLSYGYNFFEIADSSLERERVRVAFVKEVFGIQEYSWPCFDSTYYNRDYLTVGHAKDSQTKDTLSGVQVVVTSNAEELFRQQTDVDGYYSFTLPLGGRYVVEYSASGYYTKIIEFDLTGFDEWKVGVGFTGHTDMTMEPLVSGVDIPRLERPMSVCIWDEDKNLFEWDFQMAAEAKEAIEKAMEGKR